MAKVLVYEEGEQANERKITPIYTPIAAVWAVFKRFCGLGTGLE
jgi:hypothetical protein